MSNTPTRQELEFLRSIDTPTVCNLIEIAAPERRGSGYTVIEAARAGHVAVVAAGWPDFARRVRGYARSSDRR